ncbi:GNAT family N-acetyltransferase [Chromobacterium sp. IIBBL 290-4]|uniref:GNAT family N-acetyltransferase n=1 Tax=Chromobacterium sp. IIBBL 290-4 TaxID=2953890 RepID=UPI0020B81496|nr:GNAT family protein [Chromobacterium sp. IIBBL 290-4]UTH74016.1 GNAT family N-acetyltransferase [Chromobacterium sp. IIBBL 290-4]
MLFSDMPILDHPQAILRPLRLDDIQAWHDYLTLEQVYQHTSWNVRSPDDLIHYAWQPEQFTDSSALRFAIADRDSDRLLGTAGFHTVTPINASAEIAYDLSPAAWGRKLASAASASLLRWGHGHIGLVRIQATVLPSNLRSINVLERNGFEREGLLRAYRKVRGPSLDFWIYSHIQEK